MTAMKHLRPGVYGLAMAAWRKWMKEHIHVANPTDGDLDRIPADIGAAAMLGRLPPGYGWEDGVPTRTGDGSERVTLSSTAVRCNEQEGQKER